MRKVYCTKCRNFFEVDETKEVGNVASCPNCHENCEIDIKDDKNRTSLLKYISNKAYNDLYKTLDYEKAFEEYEYCIQLEPSDCQSIFGMAMAKIYGSSFDNLKFSFITETLDKYDIELNSENTFLYLTFVKDCLYSFEHFLRQGEQVLMVGDVYMDQTFFNYYFEGVKEINDVIAAFRESFEIVDQEEFAVFKEQNKNFMDNFSILENSMIRRLNETYKINEVGVVVYEGGKVKSTTEEKFDIVLPESVNLSFIPEDTNAIKKRKIFSGAIIGLGALLVVFFVIYLITKQTVFIILEFIPVVACLVIYFILKKQSKK